MISPTYTEDTTMTSQSIERADKPATLQQLDARHKLAEEKFRRAEQVFEAEKREFEKAHQEYIDGASVLGIIW
jgi:hypothetical protein